MSTQPNGPAARRLGVDRGARADSRLRALELALLWRLELVNRAEEILPTLRSQYQRDVVNDLVAEVGPPTWLRGKLAEVRGLMQCALLESEGGDA